MPEQDLVTEETLRVLMAYADVPASPLTVTGLVSGGRRRVRQRRLGTAVAIAVLALLVGVLAAVPAGVGRRAVPSGVPSSAVPATPSTTTSAGSSTCPVSEVALPAGATSAELTGISPNGRYYIGNTTDGGNSHPVIWVDGTPHQVAYPATLESVDLAAVNSAGVAAAVGYQGKNQYVMRYQGGALHQLSYPAGGPWSPTGETQLNDAGDLMVNVQSLSHDNGRQTTLIWPAGQDKPRAVLAPVNVQMIGFSTDGSLIGNDYTDNHVYVYDAQGRSGRPLPVQAGWNSSAMQVRGDWVVGTTMLGSYQFGPRTALDLDKQMAVAWNVRTGETVTLHGAAEGWAVNSTGAVAAGTQLLVLDHGQRYQLASPGPGLHVLTPGISDDGTVIGSAWAETPVGSGEVPTHRALRWKC